MQCEIAKLYIDVSGDLFTGLKKRLAEFCTFSPSSSHLRIQLKAVEEIEKPAGTVVLDDLKKWVLLPDGSGAVFQCSMRDPEDEVIVRCDFAADWSEVVLYYLAENENVMELASLFIGQLILRNRLLFHNGIILHAAAVKVDGKALLFTAPSGTGKSTQADLWKNEKEAVILNDDSPSLRLGRDGKICVYGTPWSGSRFTHTNDMAPARAIILIEQGQENVITNLPAADCLTSLLPRFYLPYHDERLMDKALNFINKLVQQVPAYCLQCTPDRRAVDLVSQWLEK